MCRALFVRAGPFQHRFARVGVGEWVRKSGERIVAQPLCVRIPSSASWAMHATTAVDTQRREMLPGNPPSCPVQSAVIALILARITFGSNPDGTPAQSVAGCMSSVNPDTRPGGADTGAPSTTPSTAMSWSARSRPIP